MNKRKTGSTGLIAEQELFLSGYYTPKKKSLIMKSPEEMSVGARLKRERFLRKLTQEQMADYLGISPSYLGAMERGVRPISRKMMERLHEKLNISYDYMLEGLALSGAAISQYVREAGIQTPVHKLNVLLNVCSMDELDACYNLVHTYLSVSRSKKE